MQTDFAEDAGVITRAVRLACLKAFAGMLNNNLAKNCLSANAVAAKVLDYYKIPYEPVAGYWHLDIPGTDVPVVQSSFPHVWLETRIPESPEALITDLAFSGAARMIVVLGQGIGFHDDALRPVYTREPKYPEFQGKEGGPKPLPFAVLQEQAKVLRAYLNNPRTPAYLVREVKTIMETAFDGTDAVNIDPSSFETYNVPGM